MGRKAEGALPQIRKHTGLGRYYVRLPKEGGGTRQVYLGKIADGIGPARAKFYELVRDVVESGPVPVRKAYGVTVNQICERFLEHAATRYQKHGRSTGTYERYKMVLRPVKVMFGTMPVKRFGLENLLQLRNWWLSQRVIRAGKKVPLSRTTVNDRMSQTIAVFARARQWGLVPKEVLWDLRDLQPLREYESTARETAPVTSAEAADIEKVVAELKKTNPTVADMMQIHWLTGCRSTELCLMRPGDIEKFKDGVWEYEPSESKTEHHHKGRVIPIGPKAQKILSPYLAGLRKDEFVFSPAKADALVRKMRVENATTHKKYHPVETRKNEPGDRYSKDTYRRCVQRAAERVGVKITPHQLRHSAATEIDQRIGKEAAQTVLGHASLKTTDIYADYNRPLAHRAALERG